MKNKTVRIDWKCSRCGHYNLIEFKDINWELEGEETCPEYASGIFINLSCETCMEDERSEQSIMIRPKH